MIIRSNIKNSGIPLFNKKRPRLKGIRGYNTWEREVKVGTLLLSNDKNNVIANKVLSYF